MLVRVIINSMGSAVGPKINVIAMPSGIIPTGPHDASCVDPGYFSVSRIYDVPNDTTSIIIRSVEYDCSTPGVCDDYEMSIIPAYDTTTTTTTTPIVPITSTTTSTSSTSTSTTSTSSTSTSTTSTSTSSSTTTTTTTSEIPGPTTTTTTTAYVDAAHCQTLYIDKNYIPVEPDPNTQLWAFVLIPGEAQTWVKLLITSGQEGDYENACVCSTIGFTLGWSTISDPPTEGQDPESLHITSVDTGVECTLQLDCGTCWEIEPPTTTTSTTGEPTTTTTTTSTTGEPTTTTTTTNEVMLSCSDFGVSFENNLPGNDNQWSAWINLPVAATGDTDFEIGFVATRNDTLGSCNTTINVTVLSGQTTGSATSMTCIENIQAESWTVNSWEIVSITPDTGKYNKIYCGVR